MLHKLSAKWYISALLVMTAVELLSWLSYGYPSQALVISLLVIVVVFILANINLLWGVAFILGELTIGSQGHLLTQLRLGIFLAVFIASLIWMVRERRIRFFETVYWKWYAALVATCIVATLTALLHHNDPKFIFLDANGYLFLGMIIPFTQAIVKREQIKPLLAVMGAGLTVLLVETCMIALLFSHTNEFAYILPDAYRWLRDFRIAEITILGYIRIFFQSHIYVLFGFIMASLAFIQGYKPNWMAAVCGSLMTLLIISYSRSFWVATIVIVVGLAVLAKRHWWKYLLMVVGSSALGYLVIFGILNVPIGVDGGTQGNLASLLSDRATSVTSDAASGSRMALLKPLAQASILHPLLGSGFGTTVTYCTLDPRIANSEGCIPYTTFAFEWGYLDLWLKFGIVFAAMWVMVMLAIALYSWNASKEIIPRAAALGVVAVLVIHAFTPYLNHPLGIGWIVFTSAIATVYARQR